MKKGIKYQPFVSDFGHSHLKGIAQNSSFIIPSLVSEGPLVDEVNGVFGSTGSRKSIDNIAIDTPFGIRYVGEIAKNSQQPPWSVFGQVKYSHPEFMKVMLLAALSEARLTGEQIVLITAVPGEWFQDETLKKKIIANLEGGHTVNRLGKRGENTVIISDVIVRSETGGLLYSHLLDKTGQLVIDDFQDLTTAVIDIGEHTTCVDVFKGLSRQGKTRSYTDVSMGQVHEAVARQITTQTGRHLESFEVRDIIIQGNGTIPQNIKGEIISFDIKPLYQIEVAKAKNSLLSIASQGIKNAADIDYILVGGGGSFPLGDILTDIYGDKVKICGQYATAQGLYNYGVRLCQANQG
jgi:hypothetical protein